MLVFGGRGVFVPIALMFALIWTSAYNLPRVWIKRCTFTDEVTLSATYPKQHDVFKKALESVSLPASEGSE